MVAKTRLVNTLLATSALELAGRAGQGSLEPFAKLERVLIGAVTAVIVSIAELP